MDFEKIFEFELISNNNNSSFEEMVKELLSVDIL